ncbi:MAG: hypothetical protein O7B99_06195, partial [Planctomycetota bacterium]|nr:hypothetical protein [Planctomycetota bacterium]
VQFLPPVPEKENRMSAEAQAKINGPAIGLIISGVLGLLGALISLVMHLVGSGTDMYEGMPAWIGGLGIVFDLLGLGLAGFVVYGGLQMRKLQGWGIGMTTAIVAMIPCQCGCLIGLPIGIWALIVLNKAEVKQAFT